MRAVLFTSFLVLVACATTAPTAELPAQAEPSPPAERTLVKSEGELPRVTFALGQPPSALFADPESLGRFQSDVASAIDDLIAKYRFEDPAMEKRLLRTRAALHLSAGEWNALERAVDRLRALESQKRDAEEVGMLWLPYSRAARREPDPASEAFRQAFREELARHLESLDGELVRDALERRKGQFEMLNAELLAGAVESQFDVISAKTDYVASLSFAHTLIGIDQTMRIYAPVKDVVAETLGAHLARLGPASVAPDLWSSRLIDLPGGKPVNIGVWDTGLDPKVLGKNAWTNPAETLNGKDDDGNGFVDDLHGIAFDTEFNPTVGDLMPLDANEDLDASLALLKGVQDLRSNVASEEASLFRRTMSGLSADDAVPFQLKLTSLANYIHGQHVADVALRGVPSGRAVNIRMSWPVEAIPTTPFDERWVDGLVASAERSIDYLRAQHVQVVNMSWRITRPMIERSLESTGTVSDPDARQKRAAAIFERLQRGLEEAFARAPEILFIAGAGNEAESVEFVQSVPAGLNLPNLLTVGAVDRSLSATGFTSYGRSIDVYANGSEIEGRVPGGKTIALSGTSVAAPQVTNLAAKLLALRSLDTQRLRKILEATASVEGEKKLPVIHPKRAIASLQTP